MISATQINYFATALAGRRTTVECETDAQFAAQGESNADGFVYFDGPDGTVTPVIYLREGICVTLNHLDAPVKQYGWLDYLSPGGPRIDVKGGAAASVLLHETEHVRLGSTDEGYVECEAERDRTNLIAVFRLAPQEARMVYWGMKWHHELESGAYRAVC